MAAYFRLYGTWVDEGEDYDGGRARWMTQLTAHRPRIKCQFALTPTDSTTVRVCLCQFVHQKVIEFFADFPINEAIFTSR